MEEKGLNQKVILVKFAVMVSVFSQIDPAAKVTRPLMYISWVLITGYAVVTAGRSFYVSRFSKRFLICYTAYVIICIVHGILDPAYQFPNYIQVMLVPLVVSVAGDFYSDLSDSRIQECLRMYTACAVVYAVWVQITYFPSYSSWLQQKQYVFMLKNSAAQIWGAAMLMLVFLLEYKSRLARNAGRLAVCYLLFIMAVSQCRTALLAAAAAVGCYVLFRSKRKLLLIFVFASAGIAAWNIPYTRMFIDQALLLNKYAGADMNTFSSGRIGLYIQALNDIKDSFFFGIGRYYVDCSYLSVFVESGLPGFLLVEFIWVSKILENLRMLADGRKGSFLLCLTVFYLVESLLEAYPPFGPGVSAFMFWFLSAVFAGQRNRIKREVPSEQP